jgi:uncharacterized protein (TIGR02231 family)
MKKSAQTYNGDIMKYGTLGFLFTTAIVTSTFLASDAFADTIDASTQITRATIYQNNGADVTRTGRIQIPSGNHEIIISNLPISIRNTDQIRAGFTNQGIAINSIKTERVYREPKATAEQERLKAAIEAQDITVTDLKANRDAIKLQLDLLTNIAKGPSEKQDSAEEWQAKLGFIGKTLPSLQKEVSSISRSIKKEEDKLSAQQKQLQDTGIAPEAYYETRLSVYAERPVTTDLTFTYIVNNTGWNTNLNASLNSTDETVSLKLVGSVYQNTGENWDNIELALSTTRPRTGALPTIPSEFVSIYDPDQERSLGRVSRFMKGAVQSELADAAPEEVVVTGSRQREASVERTTFDANFVLPGKVSIISDREAQTLPIKRYSLGKTDIVLRANPRFAGTNGYVYAVSDLKSLDTQLNNVRVNLNRDNTYLGKMRWPVLTPNNETGLPFGLDSQLDIKVTEIPPEDGDTDFFNSKRAEEKRYLFTVTNNHASEQTIEIYDRIPVSAHEDVKVTTLKSATKPSEKDLDNKAGVIKWVKTLKPGEIWNIRHEYRITYPEKQQISRRSSR